MPKARQTSYFYDANHRKPTMIVAGAPVTEVNINGGMEEAGGWSAVSTPQLNFQSSTQVDSGDSSRHVVADAVGEGIQSLAWDLEALANPISFVRGSMRLKARSRCSAGCSSLDAETTQPAYGKR